MNKSADSKQVDVPTILNVKGLTVEFNQAGEPFKAVDGLNFSLSGNQTLAIVGESGSGKSVSSLAILKLVQHLGGRVTQGEILFESGHFDKTVNLATLPEHHMRHIRGNEIAMIFQEPMTSLNPVFTIGAQICETLKLHQGVTNTEAKKQALELIDLVRLPNKHRIFNSYPHQLSGGQRQRVMIAIALSCRPKILICDEPTTALDVTVQAQVLQIIRDLREELHMGLIFISHDMAVVSEMADKILIMKQSKAIERGPAGRILRKPVTSYAQSLLAAVPRIGSMKGTSQPDYFHLPGEEKVTSGPVSVPDLSKPLLQVEDLTTRFAVHGGLLNRVTHQVHAVENVSFQIHAGETLALVGESGSGKSTIGKSIQQLVPTSGGRMLLDGADLSQLGKAEKRGALRKVQYVFQDPFGSLNPRKTAGQSVIEPALTHGLVSKKDAWARSNELLFSVGLPIGSADRYPHEFSGGQRQRICIARALSCNPRLIIADEAVSALDVSVQAQVINLLMKLQAERGLGYLFISHDMAVVERIAHRVAVMFLGQIVEIGSRAQVFENPQHPYTKKLLAAVPVVNPGKVPRRPVLDSVIPSTMHPVGFMPDPVTLQEVSKGHFIANNF